MAASLKDIAGWFERGKKASSLYMIVVCDTFDHEDYPVYVDPGEDFWSVHAEYDGTNMQRIMEVYDLNKPWTQQTEGRVWNVPEKPSQRTNLGTSGE
jgi:hypothetical protein